MQTNREFAQDNQEFKMACEVVRTRKAKKRNPLTEQHRKKIGKALKGKPAWNKGLTKNTNSGMAIISKKMIGNRNSRGFTKEATVRGVRNAVKITKEYFQWCVENISFNELSKGLKRRKILFEQNNKFFFCGNDPLWNGNFLRFQLDHIDGNKRNNNRENLRLICPNCHSQTVTYAGKGLVGCLNCIEGGKKTGGKMKGLSQPTYLFFTKYLAFKEETNDKQRVFNVK